MSESTALLLAATVGLPCALLALAVVYHARVVGRMPAAYEGWDEDIDDLEYVDEAPAAFRLPPLSDSLSPAVPVMRLDPAIADLQANVREMQTQLARQRETLTGLLSEQQRTAALRASAPRATTTRPAAAHGPAPVSDEEITLEVPGIGTAVRNLSAEGLSDRAIARRLRVGLEEVRMLARRGELAS